MLSLATLAFPFSEVATAYHYLFRSMQAEQLAS